MIVKLTDPMDFNNTIQRNITNADRWFKNNSLSLNTDKTHLLQFHTKIDQIKDLQVHYENKQITTVRTIKFLGLIIDSTLSWKQHIDSIIPKLNKACFAIRLVKPYTTYDIRNFENNLFFLFSLSFNLWNNILGQLST